MLLPDDENFPAGLFPPGKPRRCRAARRQRRPANAVLQAERLESRQMLAASITFDAGAGLITITGDGGNNQALVTAPSAGVVQVELTGIDTRQFARSAVNLVRFSGGNGADFFRNDTDVPSQAYGHRGGDTLVGGSADDQLYGGPGVDTLDGRDGDDFLDGDTQNDVLTGGAGNDTLFGGLHDDQLHGDDGNDTLLGDRGADSAWGGAGDDVIYGFTEDDVLYGGTGEDRVYGQHGNDLLYGDDDADTVGGGPGADVIYGGAGNDILTGDQDDDQLYGDGGNDVLLGWLGNDTLYGGDGDDQLYSQEDDDVVWGGAGNDIFLGGPGNDRLYGEDGNDVIHGQDGNDVLRGGAGVDTLRGGGHHDSLFGGSTVGQLDTLQGDAGFDRFLVFDGDSISDLAEHDAELRFVNNSSQWNDAELETADMAFTRLFGATGSTRLLRESLNTNALTFYKEASLGGAAGINSLSWSSSTTCGPGGCTTTYTYTRQIFIAEWNENNVWYNDAWIDVFVHEIGHNWDSDTELNAALPQLGAAWTTFLAVADWRGTNPGGYTQSLDGQWWYRSNAYFYDNYARNNPYEDMATAWEYWFENYQDPVGDHSAMQPRMDVLDSIFAQLS